VNSASASPVSSHAHYRTLRTPPCAGWYQLKTPSGRTVKAMCEMDFDVRSTLVRAHRSAAFTRQRGRCAVPATKSLLLACAGRVEGRTSGLCCAKAWAGFAQELLCCRVRSRAGRAEGGLGSSSAARCKLGTRSARTISSFRREMYGLPSALSRFCTAREMPTATQAPPEVTANSLARHAGCVTRCRS
jgi:hypothetical protein